MTNWPDLIKGLGDIVLKYGVRISGGPKWMSRAIKLASLSIVQYLVDQAGACGIAEDIRIIRNSIRAKFKAQGDAEKAKAEKLLAEAAEATYKANLPKRRDAIARAEQRKAEAEALDAELEAAKTAEEVQTLRSKREQAELDAKARREKEILDAKTKLVNAVTKLKVKNGGMFVDPEELKEFIKLTISTEEPQFKSVSKQKKKVTRKNPPTIL